MTTPIDKFVRAKNERNEQKHKETEALWTRYHESGRQPEHLEPLIQNFQGLIAAKIKEWKPPSIPHSVFEAELTKHVANAIDSFNPDKGATLNTHVNYRVQKAKRYMVQQQNLARIPEAQAYQIGNLHRAQDTLTEELGRTPTSAEIAAHMSQASGKKVTPKQVTTIQQAQRKDISSSVWDSDPTTASRFTQHTQREQEILPFVRMTLDPQEQLVFDHVYGHAGTPVITSTGQLAQRLGMSPSQVSRLKTSIATKYKHYL